MDERDFERHRPARWSTRLGAWLIDVILLGAFVALLGDILGIGGGLPVLADPLDAGRYGVLLFVYWTLFEANAGQSPGKLVLDLQVVDETDHPPTLARSAVQSFGKAFLLPLDVLIGALAMRGQRRRLFNKLSGTRVVKLAEDEPGQRRASAVEA